MLRESLFGGIHEPRRRSKRGGGQKEMRKCRNRRSTKSKRRRGERRVQGLESNQQTTMAARRGVKEDGCPGCPAERQPPSQPRAEVVLVSTALEASQSSPLLQSFQSFRSSQSAQSEQLSNLQPWVTSFPLCVTSPCFAPRRLQRGERQSQRHAVKAESNVPSFFLWPRSLVASVELFINIIHHPFCSLRLHT